MGSQKWLGLFSVVFIYLMDGLLGQTTHHYDFVLKESNFTKLCSTKSMLTVNESFPGPLISVQQGDIVYVNVHNQGNYGITLHWHGVDQPRNPWSDGPEYVTQCPLKPGTNFTYEIIFSSEIGTLWWHAHSDWTRATVHGGIVIKPKNGSSYPFTTPDSEEVIILASWFKGDVMAIIEEAILSGLEPNSSDAFTVNGEPGDLYDCSNTTTFRIAVEFGKTYLLRIVNAIMNEEMFFTIANHTLTPVASDGNYLLPTNTTYLMISPGNTMDVLVTADQSPSHYYGIAYPYVSTEAPIDNTTTTFILEYAGNYTPPATPTYPTTLPAYNSTDAVTNFTKLLRSLEADDLPQTVDFNMLITVSVGNSSTNKSHIAASLNNNSFVSPNTTSILEAYYQNLTNGIFTTDFPLFPTNPFNYTGNVDVNTVGYFDKATKVAVVDYNSSVQIVYQGTNLSAENHPMHLHGFSFYLVGYGFGNYDNASDPSSFNLVNPPRINTVSLPPLGWVAVRFVADNPGVWFQHCHLDRHATWGMETAIIVKNGPTNDTSVLPPPVMPSCS